MHPLGNSLVWHYQVDPHGLSRPIGNSEEFGYLLIYLVPAFRADCLLSSSIQTVSAYVHARVAR